VAGRAAHQAGRSRVLAPLRPCLGLCELLVLPHGGHLLLGNVTRLRAVMAAFLTG